MPQLESSNKLYPVFMKMDRMQLLIVGGGAVALEKLQFLLKSSPNARVTVMAPYIKPEIQALFIHSSYQLNLINKPFYSAAVQHFDLVIAATNKKQLNEEIYYASKHYGKIVNVADTPHFCDFYMGSIVTKGSLKIAISTNGLSPTFAKRIRQWLEQILPNNIEELLPNLKQLRDRLELNFSEKVSFLNEVTRTLLAKDNHNYDTISHRKGH